MITKEAIAGVLDYAVLDIHPRRIPVDKLKQACQFVSVNYIHALCIQHAHAGDIIRYCKTNYYNKIKIVDVVGWPFGDSDTKFSEAIEAVDLGADEIDYTMDWQSFAVNNDQTVLFNEIYRLRNRINIPLKVIIQAPLITHNQVIDACEICADAGVDYVKTSTGAIKGSATSIEDVWLCKAALKNTPVKIKVSGGVNKSNIQQFLELGVHRIGSSTFEELYE